MGISIIAGICFLLSGSQILYNLFRGSYSGIFTNMFDALLSGDFKWAFIYGLLSFGNVLNLLSLVGLVVVGILLLVRKNKTASTVMLVSGICRACAVVCTSLFWIIYPYMDNDTVIKMLINSYLWSFVAASGWILLGVMKNQKSTIAKVWFLPAILSLVSMIASWIRGGFSFSLGNVFAFLTAAAFLLYGYAVSHGDIDMSLQIAPAAKANVQRVQQSSANNYSAAEELKVYFSLFKDGVITEEEYKAKREEILKR